MATTWYTDVASDARAAEIISGRFLELFSGPTSLPQHPALVYGGNIEASMTTRITVPHFRTLGNPFTAVAEGTDSTDEALGIDSSDVDVARQVISYSMGDLMRLTDRQGIFGLVAQGMFTGFTRTLMQQICNIIDGFTLTQTATDVLTVAAVLAGKAKLGAVSGPLLMILHSKSFGELQSDLGTVSGGALQFSPASVELVNKTGGGYVGDFAGMNVFVTDDVVSAGGKRKNAILAPGAICWADGKPSISGLPTQMLVGDRLLIEEERQAGKGVSRLVGQGYLGASMGIDARGVTLNSDA